MDNVSLVTKCFNDFNLEIKRMFNLSLKDSFTLSSFLLSLKEVPLIKDLSEDDYDLIIKYNKEFKEFNLSKLEMRRAFTNAYLNSLSEVSDYTIDVSLEIIQIFMKTITELIYNNLEYTNINVLNPWSNIGSLSCLLSIDGVVKEDSIYVIPNNDREHSLAETLRRITNLSYNIDCALPPSGYKADIIVSDPFFKDATDLLIFFADYTEYLSQNGFMILNLNASFVRTRAFSDLLSQYNLTLIELINCPNDLMDGIMKSSIVVLGHDVKIKEFAQADMVSVKDIDGNLDVLESVKEYLNKFFRGELNENNVS